MPRWARGLTAARVCDVCGRPVWRFSGGHSQCVQKVTRAKIEAHWDEVRNAKASGALARIGATFFVFDAMRPIQPTAAERVELARLCWAYRRRVIHWSMPVPMVPVPLPYRLTHELVLYVHDRSRLTTWKQIVYPGTPNQVHQSIAELMKRVPWVLFGFSTEMRLAMSAGRCVETTRAIEARRLRAMADRPPVDSSIDEKAAAKLEAERVQEFMWRFRD